MKKEVVLFCLLAFLIISVCGCETIKGAYKGGAEGAHRDWKSSRGIIAQIMKADDWMRKNLW